MSLLTTTSPQATQLEVMSGQVGQLLQMMKDKQHKPSATAPSSDDGLKQGARVVTSGEGAAQAPQPHQGTTAGASPTEPSSPVVTAAASSPLEVGNRVGAGEHPLPGNVAQPAKVAEAGTKGLGQGEPRAPQPPSGIPGWQRGAVPRMIFGAAYSGGASSTPGNAPQGPVGTPQGQPAQRDRPVSTSLQDGCLSGPQLTTTKTQTGSEGATNQAQGGLWVPGRGVKQGAGVTASTPTKPGPLLRSNSRPLSATRQTPK